MKASLICDFGAQFAREPILRRMPDDSLICLFLTGGPTEPHNENVVAVSRSRDDGETWSQPETLFSHGARGLWSTELCTLFDKPMIAVHSYNAECVYRELQTFYSTTDDAGRTWTEPRSFPGGLNGVTLRQGIRLSNGEVLFPIYWQETVGRFDWTKGENADTNWPFRCGVAVGRDIAHIGRFGNIAAKDALWEPNCVELEDGHVVMYMRDDARPYLALSESFDYGRTWSAPKPTEIPNPNTKLTLIKVRGKVLLINNFVPEMGRRERLQIRVSADGLRSFEKAVDVEPETARWFYPHALADDGRETLYVAYENAHVHRLKKFAYAELGL